ncbi:MAG: flavodoxin [Frisingicoccus sp.]|uniref:flavodoxin n=1 Tax=Frisingicoccus sp. TaxID=1918627 RepID=UPI002A7F56AA|nr:flavodoxin [Frisingicoccus sp.]MDY4836133.1 flavodoxin [Frisingicoccus sp.]
MMMAFLVGCADKSGENSGTNDSVINNSSTTENTSDATETESVSEDNGSEQDGFPNMKAAVVYFSGTGNTKAVAEVMAEKTEADIYEIIPSEEYTDVDLNYNDNNCRANKEQNDDTSRPEIRNDLSATCDYDAIYLGYPIWWGTVPRIIQTYIEQYDLSDVTIYTFCTSGSSGIERSIQDLQEWYPDINIVSGKRFDGADESDIQAWLDSLN